MKNIILFLVVLCPILMQAQYFSGASAFLSLPDGTQEKQFYGILGGTFNVSMNGPDGLSVIHHNTPYLYGNFPTATDNISDIYLDVKISPNPADTYLRVESELGRRLIYKLESSLGRVVLRGQVSAPEMGLDLSKIKSGTYYLSLTDDKYLSRRIIPIIIIH